MNYIDVTEVADDFVSKEQVERLINRYFWALNKCKNKDVLELACGTGPGAGLLNDVAAYYLPTDISEELLSIAKQNYGSRIMFDKLDAEQIDKLDRDFDVIILFEALYYLKYPELFFSHASKILRPGGKILISMPNPQLVGFNKSPHSYKYLTISEMRASMSQVGFDLNVFGDCPTSNVGLRQRIFLPFKKLAVNLNIIPKTMSGKRLLKRIVFGQMVKFPTEILPADHYSYKAPKNIILDYEYDHKVLFFEATKRVAS
jgi:SAM-dependent methyltransferase